MKNNNYKMKILSKLGSLLSLSALVIAPMAVLGATNSNSIKVYDETDPALFNEDNFSDYENEISLESSTNAIGDPIILDVTALADWGVTQGYINFKITKDDPTIGDDTFGEVVIDDAKTLFANNLKVPSEIKNGENEYKITSINNSAFMNNAGIKGSVSLPNTIISIGEKAFYECTNLTSIVIPDKVKVIELQIFYHCSNLSSVVIGSEVESIEKSAFINCANLIHIDVTSNPYFRMFGGADQYTGCLIKGHAIAKDCSNVVLAVGNVTLPDTVTLVGNQAFMGFISLTSITMTNVASIDKYAFQNCLGLTEVTIGSEIKLIDEYAFVLCNNLTSVTINTTTPPILGDHLFSGVSSDFKIYVPESALETYKNTDVAGWELYKEIIYPIPANNNLAIIIGCSVGGAVLLAGIMAGIIIGIKKYNKNKK